MMVSVKFRVLVPRKTKLKVLALACAVNLGPALLDARAATTAAEDLSSVQSLEVPEPASLALFGLGLMAAARRLRQHDNLSNESSRPRQRSGRQ